MTGNAGAGSRILGSLRSADGKGVVRMEDRFDTGIDDVWSALTDPRRLVRWLGEVEGDLRLGGEFRFRFFSSGSEGTGHVEACEPPRRLLLVIKGLDEPYEQVIEAALAAGGDQAILVLEERGMPLDLLAAYRSMSRISPPTWPGVSAATPARGGTSSSLPTGTWRPAPASTAAAHRGFDLGLSVAREAFLRSAAACRSCVCEDSKTEGGCCRQDRRRAGPPETR
jgi:uncharacterized protein YndB with AHSA1/START domain